MPVDASTLIGLADVILKFFDSLIKDNRKLDDDEKSALTALFTALNETKIYIGCISRTKNNLKNHIDSNTHRSEEKEANLSRLWTKASIIIQPFNIDLAQRCLMKGDYWTNPEEWSNSDIQKANISIDTIFKYSKELLAKI